MYRKVLLLSGFIFVSSTLSFSQQAITGIVISADEGMPIPYVSIFLESNQSYGVLSNEEGAYKIVVPPAFKDDRLVFSCLGYQRFYLPIKDLRDSIENIQLEKSFIELDEVVVLSDLGLKEIVRNALSKITQNYGSKGHLLKTYFRRYTVTNDQHSHIKEGFFVVEDGIYEQKVQDIKMWMQQYRESNDYRHIRWLDDKPGMNFLFSAYRWFNSVRNHTLHFMSSRNQWHGDLENYVFTDRGTYLENGDSLIRIAYNLNPNEVVLKKSHPDSYFIYEGEMLINLRDGAIVRNTVGQGRKDYFHDIIYRKVNGKYYPSRFHYIIELSHGAQSSEHHQINALFSFYDVVTDKKKGQAIKKGRRLQRDTPIQPSTVKYDANFWQQNTTLLSMDLPSALKADLSRAIDLDQQYRNNAKN